MFDMGFLEIVLIGIVALVVIGPERLPDVARNVGRWIGKAQRFVRGVKRDLANEFDSGELRELIGDQRKQINELRQMVQTGQRDFRKRSNELISEAKSTLGEMEEVLDGEEEADADAEVARPSKDKPGAGAGEIARRSDDGDATSSRPSVEPSGRPVGQPSLGEHATRAGEADSPFPTPVPPPPVGSAGDSAPDAVSHAPADRAAATDAAPATSDADAPRSTGTDR